MMHRIALSLLLVLFAWDASPGLSGTCGYVLTAKCRSGFRGMFWTRGTARLTREIPIPEGSTGCTVWAKAWKKENGTVIYSGRSNMCRYQTSEWDCGN